MRRVAIVGCGVVGAAIAYELSQISDLQITVFDRQPPAQASTGAALGVLMGIISHKVKGTAWNLREQSIQRYESLIPELESMTGTVIPVNRQGILLLRFEDDDLANWQHLAEIRRQQHWQLDLWDRATVTSQCPHIVNSRIVGAVYSPCDRQIDPTVLTLALVEASQQNGVDFQFNTPVQGLEPAQSTGDRVTHILTPSERFEVEWVVISAGLGTTLLTQFTPTPIEIRPVLGQAMRVKLAEPLGDCHFQPVITGEDIHLVPLGNGEYWVGATVEFPVGEVVTADCDRLDTLWQGAIALCPALASAQILHTWSGLRPRPHNRPAPVIGPLLGYKNVLLATGHYRNGVLLAPATAHQIRSMIGGGQ